MSHNRIESELSEDNFKVSHRINKSEIDYGILSLRTTDGTKKIFESLPEKFTVVVRGKKIENRKLLSNKIWMGWSIMEEFKLNEAVTISRKENIVSID